MQLHLNNLGFSDLFVPFSEARLPFCVWFNCNCLRAFQVKRRIQVATGIPPDKHLGQSPLFLQRLFSNTDGNVAKV